MLGYIISGLLVVLCVLSMLARSNLKRWLGYANVVDIAFTLFMIGMFHGTFSGVVAGACAGVWMSVLLQIFRKTIGCERLVWVKGTKWYSVPVLVWHYYSPSELTWYGFKKDLPDAVAI